MASTDAGYHISITDRKTIEVTGVTSVERFDLQEFLLTTDGGPLHIKGSNLHMKHLDLQDGLVLIEGTFASLAYVPPQNGRKKMSVKRIFR